MILLIKKQGVTSVNMMRIKSM